MKMINQDTICAIATAQGGAIGIIRVSGPRAIEITSHLFIPVQGKPLTERKPYTLTFGKILSPQGEVIDEVLVSLFRAPHSYTGEDSTEIMCHGSSYILQQVIQLLIQSGCRSALPGEYTQRAFLNGKMDLSQAEAVADLIASSSAASHRLAMSQMRGGFSKELAELRNRLLHFTSLMELELDFSDHEELEFANRSELNELAAHIEQVIARLAHSFSVGNAIKNGIPVAIIGETNVGKSTLLNIIAGLLEPTSGAVYCNGKEVKGTGTDRGVVFQQYALFPWLTVKKNVMFALEMRGIKGKQAEEEAMKYLEMVQLEKFAEHYPKELSGGMKQRVAIARAYAAEPEVLLMDEPFGALDAQTRTQLQTELLETWQREKKTCFFITHDVEEAIILAQTVIIMSARPGRIRDIVKIDIPYPRTQETKMTKEFMELKNEIWSQVYQEYLEVRK